MATKSKRSKYEPKRRAEVANIRKKGACLRCSLDKRSCSGASPCVSCRRSQDLGRCRASKHRWMQCVPFSFKDVNIFNMDSTCSEETFNGLMERSSHHLVANDVQLDGGSDVSWDINAISLDFARWMSAQHMILASTSRVGILSSFTLTRLLSALIPGDLGPNIRLFIETSSALYNRGLQSHYAGVDPTDLCQVRSFTGNKVLEDLEKALNNTALAKASLTKLKALFIILFGTIIAVGYSSQGIQSSKHNLSTETLADAQLQLLRRLAHRMIEVADRVYLLDDEASREDIMKDSYVQWNRRAVFVWREVSGQVATMPESAASQLLSTVTLPEHTYGEATDPIYDFPPSEFFSQDHNYELLTHDLLCDVPWADTLETFNQDGPSIISVHDHTRRSSYVITFPKNCAFLRFGSIPSMIDTYEAQHNGYRLYHDTAESLDKPHGSLEAPSHYLRGPTSIPLQKCDICDASLDVNNLCAACGFASSWFPQAQNQRPGWIPEVQAACSMDTSLAPHIISMQAYGSGAQPMELDPEVDYSITDAPSGYATYSQQSYDYLNPTSAKRSQWECHCALPQGHRQISRAYWNEGLVSNDLGHSPVYPASSMTVEGERQLNLLI